jgi:hypothetical protein
MAAMNETEGTLNKSITSGADEVGALRCDASPGDKRDIEREKN